MRNTEIATLVNRQFSAAEDGNSIIRSQREKALKFYRQETDRYIPRVSQDHSNVKTANTRDMVETVLPQVLEPFMYGDAVVFIDNGTPQDKKLCEFETEQVNSVLENDRFEVFETWFRDALLQKNGYVKTILKDEVKRVPQQVQGLNADQLSELNTTLENKEIDDLVIEGRVSGEVVDIKDMSLELLMSAVFNVSFVQVVRYKRIKVCNVAPENLRINLNWDRVHLKGCPYVGESVFMLRGELKELYPDKAEEIDRLPSYYENDTAEHVARRQDANKGLTNVGVDKQSELVELREHYVLADLDESGTLKQWKVCTGRDTNDILAMEQVEDNPYDVVTPIRQPHQHYGMSVADLMIDIDEIDTMVWRSSLDGMYRSLMPRPIINNNSADTETTYADLASTHPMAPIRVNGSPSDAIQWTAPPDTSKYAQQMFPLVDAMLEKRTGLSRMAQGLDSTALADSTNVVGAMVMNQSLMRVKMILRTFAETGVRDLMLRIRSMLISMGQIPSQAPVERQAKAKVGIGLSDRNENIVVNERVLNLIEKIVGVQGGVDESGMVNATNVYNVLMDYLAGLQVANRESYITNPSQIQPPKPQETPVDAALEVEKGKMIVQANGKAAELELERKKHQDDVRLKLLEIQLQAREKDRQFQIELEKVRESVTNQNGVIQNGASA